MKQRAKQKKSKEQSTYQLLTTDQEELEFRRQRAKSEPIDIQFLDQFPYPFCTYHVTSELGGAYSVEIRSLSDKINTCSCPDFRVNTLNTCKHIEGVLHYLAKSEKKQLASYIRQGSPFVEIYLNPNPSPTVSVAWPNYPVKRHAKVTPWRHEK